MMVVRPWLSVGWLVSVASVSVGVSVSVTVSMGVSVSWSLRLGLFGGCCPVRILIMVLSWLLFGWCRSVLWSEGISVGAWILPKREATRVYARSRLRLFSGLFSFLGWLLRSPGVVWVVGVGRIGRLRSFSRLLSWLRSPWIVVRTGVIWAEGVGRSGGLRSFSRLLSWLLRSPWIAVRAGVVCCESVSVLGGLWRFCRLLSWLLSSPGIVVRRGAVWAAESVGWSGVGSGRSSWSSV